MPNGDYIPGWANIPSTVNSTETSAASFTGTYENIPSPWGLVRSYSSNQNGTVTIEISNNGTTAHTTFTRTITAGTTDSFPFEKGDAFVRVSWSGTAPTALSIKTSYGHYGNGVSPIGSTIGTQAVASVVKAVISGVGDTTATVTDHKALQVTPPPEGKTAFGEALVGALEPLISLDYAYSLNPLLVTMRDNQSGSSAISNSMAQLTTGAAANSSSSLQSTQIARYQPGMGLRGRYTAMYTTGVANSIQIMGLGDSGEGFFFGYNGTSFGILRRYGGSPEVRTLTVTTASSTAENITITLDGDADATVAVTASGNITTTANEIAAHDYSDVGKGWDAVAVGSTVIFTSWDSAVHTGTYSLSVATTAVGTFAQTLAGVAPTDSWTAQASWNGDDKFDGTGITGVTLDPTKLNVYQIDFQYLGAGLIRFCIEDPNDGELHLVHSIRYANSYTRPSLDNPSVTLYALVENVSNTTSLVLSTGSAGVFNDGKKVNTGIKRGLKARLTLGATSAETPITSFRVSEVYKSRINRTPIKLNYISASVEHTKPCAINFYLNATLTGASFAAIDSNTSSVYQDTSATAASGGYLFFTLYLGKTGQQLIDLKDDLTIGELGPGNTLTVTLAPTSGNAAEGNIGFNFTERL